MTKFKLTWVMEVDDDELLELVNDYQDAVEEPCFETLKEVPAELILIVLDDSDYIEQEIDDFLDVSDIDVALLPNEEV